jgi:hypothetical protein
VTELWHPSIDVIIEDAAVPTRPEGGSITLDALRVPYATATIVLPLTAATLLDNLDPRDDHRVIINGGNTGHWELVSDGYGHGGYGRGPYGG